MDLIYANCSATPKHTPGRDGIWLSQNMKYFVVRLTPLWRAFLRMPSIVSRPDDPPLWIHGTSFFRLPWGLFNGPTYKVAKVARAEAPCELNSRNSPRLTWLLLALSVHAASSGSQCPSLIRPRSPDGQNHRYPVIHQNDQHKGTEERPRSPLSSPFREYGAVPLAMYVPIL